MSEDKKQQNEQITQAGAVELDETNLDDAAGGGADIFSKIDPVGSKFDPSGFKLDPGGFKFDPGGAVGKKAF